MSETCVGCKYENILIITEKDHCFDCENAHNGRLTNNYIPAAIKPKKIVKYTPAAIKPKKIVKYYRCPKCNIYIGTGTPNGIIKNHYCSYCGQAIDWSDYE